MWQKAEGILIDRRYLLRGETPADPDIKLIGLSSTSFQLDTLAPEEIAASPILQKMQQPWPWDRSVYAAILDKLMDAGAKVVLFDFVFASQKEGDDVYAKELEKYKDHVVIGEMTADEEGEKGKTKKLTMPNDELLFTNSDSIIGLVDIWMDKDDTIRRARYHTSVARETLESTELDPKIQEFLHAKMAAGKIPDNLEQITARAAEKFKGKINTPPPGVKAFISFQGPQPLTAPGRWRTCS
jgi:CHASE2 domain-containing sensor protein